MHGWHGVASGGMGRHREAWAEAPTHHPPPTTHHPPQSAQAVQRGDRATVNECIDDLTALNAIIAGKKINAKANAKTTTRAVSRIEKPCAPTKPVRVRGAVSDAVILRRSDRVEAEAEKTHDAHMVTYRADCSAYPHQLEAYNAQVAEDEGKALVAIAVNAVNADKERQVELIRTKKHALEAGLRHVIENALGKAPKQKRLKSVAHARKEVTLAATAVATTKIAEAAHAAGERAVAVAVATAKIADAGASDAAYAVASAACATYMAAREAEAAAHAAYTAQMAVAKEASSRADVASAFVSFSS